ncbi:MAG TPA: cytochrome c-type biogenesis protein CcmH, partial [Candidatus Limnocylindria bacterium]
MRRWLLPLAAVGVAALAFGVLLAMLQPAAPATRAEQARALAAELRCPDCESLSVAESRTASAAAIRQEIDQQLAAGRTPAEIRASFVARYGEWILLQPTSPLIWILPAVAP